MNMNLALLSVALLSTWNSIKGDEHDHKVSLLSSIFIQAIFTKPNNFEHSHRKSPDNKEICYQAYNRKLSSFCKVGEV